MATYDINPAPQGGVGAFGLVPGPVGLPSPAADLTAQIPDLPAINKQASQNIYSQMLGRLSPGMMAQLQDAAATQANAGGMAGTNKLAGSLYGNLDLLKNILSSEQLQQMGLQNYNAFVPTVSKTQTVSPETQIALAERNATTGAAPNPQAAASYAESLFNRYMQRFGGGPASGTGGYRIVGGGGAAPESAAERNYRESVSRGFGGPGFYGGGGGVGGGGVGASPGASFGVGNQLSALQAGGLSARSAADEDFWSAVGLALGMDPSNFSRGSTNFYGPGEAPAEAATPGVSISQPINTPFDTPAGTPPSAGQDAMVKSYLESLPWE